MSCHFLFPPPFLTPAESQASNKRAALNDMHFVNLSMVSDVAVREEKAAGNSKSHSDPPTLNVAKLNTRAQNNIDRKKLAAKAFKAGVSPEGQKLFQVISKT